MMNQLKNLCTWYCWSEWAVANYRFWRTIRLCCCWELPGMSLPLHMLSHSSVDETAGISGPPWAAAMAIKMARQTAKIAQNFILIWSNLVWSEASSWLIAFFRVKYHFIPFSRELFEIATVRFKLNNTEYDTCLRICSKWTHMSRLPVFRLRESQFVNMAI